jgi:hypothetical protein
MVPYQRKLMKPTQAMMVRAVPSKVKTAVVPVLTQGEDCLFFSDIFEGFVE